MRHPHYENGKLVGHYADVQTTRQGVAYTSPPVPDDHSDILAWIEAHKPKPFTGKTLEQRITELETLVAELKEKIQ